MANRGWNLTDIRGIVRALRNLASGPRVRTPRWSIHQAMFDRSAMLVSVFYLFTAVQLYERAWVLSDLKDPVESLDLLWPVWWFRDVGIHQSGRIVAQFGLAAGLLGIVWWRLRTVRVLVSAALLLYAAYANSHGAIGNNYHEWFWVSVCFWLLPAGRPEETGKSRSGRMHFLTAFSAAPLLVLFFYTLSGAYKCGWGLIALLRGQTGGFSMDALALTTARRALETDSHPMWADFVIQHPWVGWPIYTGLILAELLSVFVFFRPALHRAWGLMLIMFHFGTLLFLDIFFEQHVLINGLLLVMSPFAIGGNSWRAQLFALPVVGDLAYLLLRGRTPLPLKAKSRTSEPSEDGAPPAS